MRIGRIIPKTDRELEQFFRDLIVKVGDTDTNLSDEEQKSINPVIGMVQGIERQMRAMERDNRMLKVTVARLERRLKDIEGEL